jgi:hypothetical protein
MDNISYPVKLYRLGEPPKTINSRVDLDYWTKDGWSMTPQVYKHQEFPRVIYHFAEGNKTVKSEEEMDFYMKKGWSSAPRLYSEADEIRRKIAYHESEAERLKIKLEGLEPKIEDTPEEQPEECECVIVAEPQPEAVLPKKRGRKPKVV